MTLIKAAPTENPQLSTATILCKSVQIITATICLSNHELTSSHLNRFYFNLIGGTYGATIIVQSFNLARGVHLLSEHTTMVVQSVVLIGAYLWICGILFDNINQEKYKASFWATMLNPILSLVILMFIVIELADKYCQSYGRY